MLAFLSHAHSSLQADGPARTGVPLLSQASDASGEASLVTTVLLASKLCQLESSGCITKASKSDQQNILQTAALLVQQL
jgi:hypothetical protein